jgi:hypothetical protein
MERIRIKEIPRLRLRISPSPFLGRPERVMGGISRKENSLVSLARKKGRTGSPQELIELCYEESRCPEQIKSTSSEFSKNDQATSTSTRLPSSNNSRELWRGCSRKNPPDSFPQATRKGHGKDTKGRNPSVGGFWRDED